LSQGKGALVECDMTRYDDLIAIKIKTPIPFVVSRITQKNTQSSLRSKFVCSCSGELWVASVDKNAEVIID
jgi:hypothetical protein